MSLQGARRVLQWNVVMEALTAADVEPEIVALVKRAKEIADTVHLMADVLTGAADVAKAKNYVKVEMVGMLPPFDRAYVELVRPGGMTSHELRELLRDRLEHVRSCLMQGEITNDAFRKGMILGIDEDLAKDAV